MNPTNAAPSRATTPTKTKSPPQTLPYHRPRPRPLVGSERTRVITLLGRSLLAASAGAAIALALWPTGSFGPNGVDGTLLLSGVGCALLSGTVAGSEILTRPIDDEPPLRVLLSVGVLVALLLLVGTYADM